LEFYSRHLLAAATDSCCPLLAFRTDLFERAPVAFDLGLLIAQCLPTLDYDIDVLRIEFHPAADALSEFRGG
jgi:hypothetical protein